MVIKTPDIMTGITNGILFPAVKIDAHILWFKSKSKTKPSNKIYFVSKKPTLAPVIFIIKSEENAKATTPKK